MLRAVFLDVGHTLLRERTSRAEIYADVARIQGARVTEGAMLEHMRRAHQELPEVLDGAYRYSDPWFGAFIRKIFQGYLGLPDAVVSEATRALFEAFEDPASFDPYPGLDALLDRLEALGLSIGVISNWSARLPRLLAALGLASRLEPILCSAIEGCEKPDPTIFRRALERARVRPEQALHAGDHPVKDLRAAQAIGMSAVRVDHGGRRPESPGPFVTSLDELASYVEARATT